MTPEEARYFGYERTPWWLFWKPRWRLRVWRYSSDMKPLWIYAK